MRRGGCGGSLSLSLQHTQYSQYKKGPEKQNPTPSTVVAVKALKPGHGESTVSFPWNAMHGTAQFTRLATYEEGRRRKVIIAQNHCFATATNTVQDGLR